MLKKVVIGLVLLTAVSTVLHVKRYLNKENPLHNTSVKITNREMNHGGTGIILNSDSNKSQVLTNAHVCEVVKDGGVVITESGNKYQVNSTKISQASDLCILSVLSDLHYGTKLAAKTPEMYDDIAVAGHPALMPNIISKGHLSGKDILQVMTGIKPCTDFAENPVLCAFLGGIPQIRSFDSRLVSATIMPGSSGSGVYNSKNELIGVVFAGQGDFGYGWTVPYEQVKNFLETEQTTLKDNLAKQEVSLKNPDQQSKIKEAIIKCSKLDVRSDKKLKDICSILGRDNIWRK